MHFGGFWKQKMEASDKAYTLRQGGYYVGRQEMENKCTRLLCISQYVHVKHILRVKMDIIEPK